MLSLLKKLYNELHVIYEAAILIIGIMLAASLTTTYMFTVAPVLGFVALLSPDINLAKYAINVWLGFDKLWNAILWGDHRETVSSRLGKSTIYKHKPVFVFRFIDRAIAHMLDTVDRNHCEKSIDWSVGRPNVKH